ncbi:MAG TPA: ribonuclease P protein component [Anaerolineales bacterium]|nr:ribonuclease P protein component [Anaerolineales bacterium]
MQRKFRLTRSEDFKRVRRYGKSYAHPLAVLIVQTHNQPRLKVGVAAGRTVGTSVYRNRAKRLLREAIRPLLPNIASGLDLILIARPGLVSATLQETRQALHTLLQRAQILIPLNES